MKYAKEGRDKLLNYLADFEGGPAFPSTASLDQHIFPGMTVRQYYAAKAMAAIIGNDKMMQSFEQVLARQTVEIELEDMVAEGAFYFADAMLKAEAGDE